MSNRNPTWTIFSYELNRNVRRRSFLFSTFILPVIAAFLIVGLPLLTQGGGNGGDDAEDSTDEVVFEGIETAGYVDAAGAFAPVEGPTADVLIAYPDEAAAQAALEADEIDVYYLIPEDYLENGDVTVVLPRFSIGQITSAPINQLLYSQLDVAPETLMRLANPANIEAVDVSTGEGSQFSNDEVNNTLTQVFALLLVFTLFGTNGYLMQSVIEEKETRLVEILLSSVRPLHLLVGKILALGLLGLLQLVVYVGVIIVASELAGQESIYGNLNISLNVWIIVVVYFILGYLLFAALFGAVGAISTSISEGPTYTVFFVLPAMSPWFFATAFALEPNGPLATGMSLFPLTSPLAMVMRFAVTEDIPLVEVLLSIAILVVSIVVMMWFAGRLFRVTTLLSGKVPRLSDLPKLVRG
ncbi:MAG: ABC transporter permease [Anaerolineae bacterium]